MFYSTVVEAISTYSSGVLDARVTGNMYKYGIMPSKVCACLRVLFVDCIDNLFDYAVAGSVVFFFSCVTVRCQGTKREQLSFHTYEPANAKSACRAAESYRHQELFAALVVGLKCSQCLGPLMRHPLRWKMIPAVALWRYRTCRLK